jgi:hypothetical protein
VELSKVLIQLDTDLQASSFDAIVALDSGVDHVLAYSEVDELNVLNLVHGAMFTRAPQQLSNTAIFIGGSDVSLGERLFKKVQDAFFGPLRVSVMLDSNGSNTTAAAAVLSVLRHAPIGPQSRVAILGGTGPVGRRIAQMTASMGAHINLGSRNQARAERVVEQLGPARSQARAVEIVTHEQLDEVLATADIVFSAGAAGVEMIPQSNLQRHAQIRFVVDLNAVPPFGVGGIKPDDRGAVRDGKTLYGAIGVGSLKMKIHQRALQQLFESNQALLDSAEIMALGKTVIVMAPAAS